MLFTKLLDKCWCPMIKSAAWIQTHLGSCQLEIQIAKFQKRTSDFAATCLLNWPLWFLLVCLSHREFCTKCPLFPSSRLFLLGDIESVLTVHALLCKCAKSLSAIVFTVAMLTSNQSLVLSFAELLHIETFSTLSCVQILICYSWQQY